MVGDSRCGKTALLHVFAKDSYPEVRTHTRDARSINNNSITAVAGRKRDRQKETETERESERVLVFIRPENVVF